MRCLGCGLDLGQSLSDWCSDSCRRANEPRECLCGAPLLEGEEFCSFCGPEREKAAADAAWEESLDLVAWDY